MATLTVMLTVPHKLRDSNFLTPKIRAKFDWGHPHRWYKTQVGYVKVSEFQDITCCISKTVQVRHIVSLKVK